MTLALVVSAWAQPSVDTSLLDTDTDAQLEKLDLLAQTIEEAYPEAAAAVRHEACEAKCQAALAAATVEPLVMDFDADLVECVKAAEWHVADFENVNELIVTTRSRFPDEMATQTDEFWREHFLSALGFFETQMFGPLLPVAEESLQAPEVESSQPSEG